MGLHYDFCRAKFIQQLIVLPSKERGSLSCKTVKLSMPGMYDINILGINSGCFRLYWIFQCQCCHLNKQTKQSFNAIIIYRIFLVVLATDLSALSPSLPSSFDIKQCTWLSVWAHNTNWTNIDISLLWQSDWSRWHKSDSFSRLCTENGKKKPSISTVVAKSNYLIFQCSVVIFPSQM